MNAVNAPLLAAFSIVVLAGCTTTRTLSVSVDNKTAPVYVQGKPMLQSVKRNTVAVRLLTLTYKTDLGDLLPPTFLVAVRNGGEQPISLSRDDITASVEGRAIHLLTYEEYCDEITRRLGREMATIEAAWRGVDSPPPVIVKPWENLDQTDRLYRGGVSYDFATLRSAQADAAFIEQGSAHLGALHQRRESLLADAQLMMVAEQYSVAPGETINRVIRLSPSDLSSGDRLNIKIKTDGEMHEFFYDVRG
ncbi:MAG TPA: hypothetical protein VLW52_15355 [Opitutaceae bacterium]|nr:hypothetical protein [Opitutaceae bacterium]